MANVLAPLFLERLELRELVCAEHAAQRPNQFVFMLVHRRVERTLTERQEAQPVA